MADLLFDIGNLGRRQHRDRVVVFHDISELRDMHEVVAWNVRHVLVHFGDDDFGTAGGRQGIVAGNPETAIPVFIGQRHLCHSHVHREIAVEERRHVREVERVEVSPVFGYGCAGIAPDEIGDVAEMPFGFRSQVFAIVYCEHVENLHIVETIHLFHHFQRHYARHAGGMAEHNVVIVFNGFDCFFHSHEVSFFFPVHGYVF